MRSSAERMLVEMSSACSAKRWLISSSSCGEGASETRPPLTSIAVFSRWRFLLGGDLLSEKPPWNNIFCDRYQTNAINTFSIINIFSTINTISTINTADTASTITATNIKQYYSPPQS
ncbi:hypothetical protein ACLKA7_007619 [Drosophila subpalustris]